STTGSISFGTALVAGRNRVPRPATGKTALRTGLLITLSFGSGQAGRRARRAKHADNKRRPPSFPSGRSEAVFATAAGAHASWRVAAHGGSPLEQQILRLVDARRQIGRAALVGMQLDHEPAMRRLDLRRAGARLEPQYLIGFGARHGAGAVP